MSAPAPARGGEAVKAFTPQAIGQVVMRQFNNAFALMSIIPLLLCVYLITVRFFSLEALVGINGIYVLMAVIFALLGLSAGRLAIGNIIRQLTQEHATTERLVEQLAGLNDRLTQELFHRAEVEDALKREKAALEEMNTIMMNREGRIIEVKKEVNALHEKLGLPPRYQL